MNLFSRLSRPATLAAAIAGIAALNAGPVRAMNAIDADSVVCGYSTADPDPVSNEVVAKWFQTKGLIGWKEPVAKTTARDPLTPSLAPSHSFIGHVGGGGGSRILYDPAHRVLAICTGYDTTDGLYIVSDFAAPPFATAKADLSHIATKRGIGIGSTVADVRAVYGPAALQKFDDETSGLSYLRQIKAPGGAGPDGLYSIETWFAIKNGKVSAIERFTGTF